MIFIYPEKRSLRKCLNSDHVLTHHNRKTFGKKSQHADSSTEDETSFMALLNKPLVNHPSTEMKSLVGEENCEADLEKDDQV